MEFDAKLMQALEAMHIEKLTDMQKEVIPHALKKEDIFVQSPVGTGKTLAYLLPVIENIELQGKGKHKPQVLILAPTRELCLQITSVIRELLTYREGIRTLVLTGGTDMNRQIHASSKGADIVVGTPARILDHLRRHTFKKELCRTLVMDEADDMLSMGFEEDVRNIIDQLPLKQIMLFSATYPREILHLKDTVLHDPFVYRNSDESLSALKYTCIVTNERKKPDELRKLLKRKGQILVFTNKRSTADYLCSLFEKEYTCGAIHSEMNYGERKRLMEDFRHQKIHVLFATEVAARGIDLSSLSLLVCYDLPSSKTDLIHRFGRASRLNHQSEAVLLLKTEEKKYLPEIRQIFPELQTISHSHREH